MNFTIQDFKATVLDRGLINSDRQRAHTAIIKFENGDWIGVSRYHDEDVWTGDCAFRANGYPVYSNGTGARYGAQRLLTDETIISQLADLAAAHPIG